MKLKNQNGVALVMVMVFMTMSFVGLQSYSLLGSSQLIAEDLFVKHHQAFYLAEAAAENAKARLRDDFSTFPVPGDGNIFTMGDGEYYFNVTQTSDPTERRITAYGAVPDFATVQAAKVVELVIKNNPASMYDYAMYASGSVKLESSGTVNGDFMGASDLVMESSGTVNGDITISGDVGLQGSATVNGDITAGGDYTCEGSSCGLVSGTVSENASVNFVQPVLDMDQLKSVAQSQTYNGHDNYYLASEIDPENPPFPTTFYETPPSGGDPGVPWVVFIEGNLVLESSAVVGGFIVTNGDGKFESSVVINGVVYVTSAELIAESTVVFDGSVITANGATVKFESSAQITWNNAYADAIKAQNYSQASGGSLSQLSWNEKAS